MKWTSEDIKRLNKRKNKKNPEDKNIKLSDKNINQIELFGQDDLNCLSKKSTKKNVQVYEIVGRTEFDIYESLSTPTLELQTKTKYTLWLKPMGAVRTTAKINRFASGKSIEKINPKYRPARRYQLYKDKIKVISQFLKIPQLPNRIHSIIFYYPMAKSKSKKYLKENNNQLCTDKKPDLDNFLKGLWDALETADHHIGSVGKLEKRHCFEGFGRIEIIF